MRAEDERAVNPLLIGVVVAALLVQASVPPASRAHVVSIGIYLVAGLLVQDGPPAARVPAAAAFTVLVALAGWLASALGIVRP